MNTVNVVLPESPFLTTALVFVCTAIVIRIFRWILDILP